MICIAHVEIPERPRVLEIKIQPDVAMRLEVLIREKVPRYDVFRVPVIRKDIFTLPDPKTGDTAGEDAEQERSVLGQRAPGPIQSWENFEQYPWPRTRDIDLSPFEWLERNLPENMGCYDLTAHILELVTFSPWPRPSSCGKGSCPGTEGVLRSPTRKRNPTCSMPAKTWKRS